MFGSALARRTRRDRSRKHQALHHVDTLELLLQTLVRNERVVSQQGHLTVRPLAALSRCSLVPRVMFEVVGGAMWAGAMKLPQLWQLSERGMFEG